MRGHPRHCRGDRCGTETVHGLFSSADDDGLIGRGMARHCSPVLPGRLQAADGFFIFGDLDGGGIALSGTSGAF